jgi:hypothetical protein
VASSGNSFYIEIDGHTDNTGNSGNNQTLSASRAGAVRDYLHAKAPKLFRSNRVTVRAFGDSQPLASRTRLLTVVQRTAASPSSSATSKDPQSMRSGLSTNGAFTARLEIIGQQLNALREELLRGDLLNSGYIFTAGIVRAAEEAVLVAFNMFSDNNVSERQL